VKANGGAMDELTVNRWKRFGEDRLYVNLGDGSRVGWLDLQTGQATLERADLKAEFERAVARHQETDERTGAVQSSVDGGRALVEERVETQAPSAPPREAPAHADHEPFAIRIDWRDVGTHRAGAAVAEQAAKERRAAPVRTVAARLLGVHTDERAWRIGAAGERKVAARLERLGEPWHVLHAVPVGNRGADIDHIVIGPGGVFTVNAKHHPDARVWVGGNTFMVNGHRQPYVRNARHEARRASRLLSAAVDSSVEVSGVIAVVGAHKGFTVKTQPEDVHVVTRKEIAAWLGRMPRRLGDQRVNTIVRAARRSDTWK
jgi:hypothetical protein